MSDSNNSRQNQGYLYPNERANDRQPNFRGKLNIDGKEWLVSGWTREKEGKEMISLALTDPASLPKKTTPNAPSGGQQNSSSRSAGPSAGLGDIFDGLPG